MEEKKKYVPDSRFEGMKNEARFTAVFWAAYFLAVMSTSYFLGKGDPTEYSYMFGFPIWFVATIGVTMVFIVLGIYVLKRRFKNVSLDAEDPEYDYEKDERRV